MIYLLRHGQTDYNKEGRFGGNPPLNVEGEKEIADIASFFNGIQIKKIFCSTLIRSNQSAQILNQKLDAQIVCNVSPIDEIDPGDFNNVSFERFKTVYREEYLQRQKNKYTWLFPNGESYESAWQRVKPWIDSIFKDEDDVIIISHKGVNRLIVGNFIGMDKKAIPFIHIQQNKIIIFDKLVKTVKQVDIKYRQFDLSYIGLD